MQAAHLQMLLTRTHSFVPQADASGGYVPSVRSHSGWFPELQNDTSGGMHSFPAFGVKVQYPPLHLGEVEHFAASAVWHWVDPFGHATRLSVMTS
jgi:hypothetical protein